MVTKLNIKQIATMDRRKFVKGVTGLGLSVPLGCFSLSTAQASNSEQPSSGRVFSCAQLAQRHHLICSDLQGQTLFNIPLPARGHGMTLAPNNEIAVVFARRPGQFMLSFDPATGQSINQYQMPSGRHCFGHGCFDNSGLLYASQGFTQDSAGVIGVYDVANNFKEVRTLTGFGIGPHEILFHPDQQHLIVAVGGIQTHGRDKVNLATMAPSLVYLDKQTGAVVQSISLPDHLLSIRHLAVDEQGLVALACQYQGDEAINPLLYTHQLGQTDAMAVAGEEEEWLRFNDYLGSVAIYQDQIIATSPRGNCFAIWHKATRELISITPLTDVCGAAPLTANGFVLTTGQGKLASKNSAVNTQWAWDNHLMATDALNL